MSSITPTTKTTEPRRLKDSPWYWVYVFSTGAFAALMLMQTKYHNRQGHLERVYHYGTQTLSRPAGATLSNGAPVNAKEPVAADSGTSSDVAAESDASAVDDTSDQPPFAVGPRLPKQKLLITLEPLRIIVGATMVVSFIALLWTYWRRRAKAMQ